MSSTCVATTSSHFRIRPAAQHTAVVPAVALDPSGRHPCCVRCMAPSEYPQRRSQFKRIWREAPRDCAMAFACSARCYSPHSSCPRLYTSVARSLPRSRRSPRCLGCRYPSCVSHNPNRLTHLLPFPLTLDPTGPESHTLHHPTCVHPFAIGARRGAKRKHACRGRSVCACNAHAGIRHATCIGYALLRRRTKVRVP